MRDARDRTVSHQTVRLARGHHYSPEGWVCVMELASMLAGETFSDRPRCASPVIAAFLRTYNDGLDHDRRDDLYPLAALLVGTASGRVVERRRANRCIEFARGLGADVPCGHGAIAMSTSEASGTWAALAALRTGPSADVHTRSLAFVSELAAGGLLTRRRRWAARWFGTDRTPTSDELLDVAQRR